MTHLAVVGAHLAGEPLHHQLADRDATYIRRTTTAPCYRLFALATDPPKPGLVRVAEDDPGAGAVEVEVYDLDDAALGSFLAGVGSPLCLGTVRLADGTSVHGFLCESVAVEGCPDITATGGWRAHLARPDDPDEL